MAMYGGKKVCPNCGQPQEKNWDKCPFCIGMTNAMGGAPMAGPPMGGPPPPMGGYAAPQAYGPPTGNAAPKTVMLGVGGTPGVASQLLGWVVPLKGPHKGELHTLKP